MAKLTDMRCKAAPPGTCSDGGGLLLQVKSGSGRISKSWIYRYTVYGKQTWMGLGSYPDVSLAQARQKAADARRLRADGIDPLSHRRAVRASLSQQQAQQAKSLTFDQAADQYIAAHRAGWRSHKHAKQWATTLRTYVSPVFGRLPVQSIDVGLVLKALEPIWQTRTDTASRVRGRIESVLDWARVRGYRAGENPARWRGHLDHLLARPSKVRAVKHYSSLPYAEIGKFIVLLREREGASARALEFIILTAARAGEVVGMRWAEVDLVAKAWVIPASRMKAGREHRVPLNMAAVALLERIHQNRENDFVFPGQRRAGLSHTALDRLLRYRMKSGVCTHGFRATFRTWAAERTSFQRETIEAALAHVVGDETERAYQRGDMFEKRRHLMDAWARYIDQEPASAEVVPLRTA